MIDSKIIGMSKMSKYRGTEVFSNIIVELVAGSQSNNRHHKSKTKITLPDNVKWWKSKNQTVTESIPFTLHPEALHKNEWWMNG